MLTSSSRYLDPDLHNVPQTMDSMASPLALLAQACDNIGKDAKSAKSILNSPIKTASGGKPTSGGSRPNSLAKPSSPIQIKSEERRSTPPARENTPKSNDPATKSPSPHRRPDKTSPFLPVPKKAPSPRHHAHARESRVSPTPQSVVMCTKDNGLTISNSGLYANGSVRKMGLDTGEAKSLSPTRFPAAPYSLPLDYSADSVLNQYMQYMEARRLETERLMGYQNAKVPVVHGPESAVCRDAHCLNCQLVARAGHTGTTGSCDPNCARCVMERSAEHARGGSLLGMDVLHSSPWVCHWFSGQDRCGRRFATSEELFQHLKSHTSSIQNPTESLPSIYKTGLPLLPDTYSLLAYQKLLASSENIPKDWKQFYPRSPSPGSVLAANRFHPYLTQHNLASGLHPRAAASSLSSLQLYPGPPMLSPSMAHLHGQRLGALAAASLS